MSITDILTVMPIISFTSVTKTPESGEANARF